MFTQRNHILPIIAILLLGLFTSIEAHLFLTEMDIIKDAQEEREANKEVDQLREWKLKQHKVSLVGGDGNDHDDYFIFTEYRMLFATLIDDVFSKLIRSHCCIHVSKSRLYVWFCSLKIDC